MAKRSPVPARAAIQSDEQAGLEAQEYKDARAEIDRLEAAEKSAIASLKQVFAKLRKPHEEVRDNRFTRVQNWSEATRNGRKTIKFPNGRLFRWRKASRPRVVVNAPLETIVKSLMQRPDWEKYLSVKLKKSNLSANREVVEATEGLDLDDSEFISIG